MYCIYIYYIDYKCRLSKHHPQSVSYQPAACAGPRRTAIPNVRQHASFFDWFPVGCCCELKVETFLSSVRHPALGCTDGRAP